MLVFPIFKNKQTSLEPSSLYRPHSNLHSQISQRIYLKQSVSISSHFLFSQFQYNPCHHHSAETVFVTINLYVVISNENACLHLIRLFALFGTIKYSLLVLGFHYSNTLGFPLNSMHIPFPSPSFSPFLSKLYMLGFPFFFFPWVISFISCSF